MSEGHTTRPGPAAAHMGADSSQMQASSTPPSRMEMPKETVTPTGFFTGFNIKYPEYELLTPQTLQEFTIRSMSVAEEEILKGSLVTVKRIPIHINDVIWTCLVKKPSHIVTKEDFFKNTTLRDRDALLYALYHITYKDIHNYDVQCNECGEKFPISLQLSNIFKMSAWTGEPMEILNKRLRVDLKTVDASAILKQPTLFDEQEILNDMLFQSEKNLEIAQEMAIIDSFELNSEDRDPVLVSGKQNLFSAYNSLPAADRKLINKEYMEAFGKFAISLDMSVDCQKCGSTNETRLDLVQQLFRAMYE